MVFVKTRKNSSLERNRYFRAILTRILKIGGFFLISPRIRLIAWVVCHFCLALSFPYISMKAKRVYRIILENESRLEEVGSWQLTPLRLTLLALAAMCVMLLIAGVIIWLTPLHSWLPGYLKETERAASVENLLRLDSLNQAFEKNKEFFTNLQTVLDTERTPTDSVNSGKPAVRLTSDSLLPRSKEEERFINMMQERERYNISVIAPLASEGMIFSPVNAESVFTSETRGSLAPRVLLAEGAPVECMADGTVVAVYPSEADGGGHTVLIQHGKGFLSSYSRLVVPTVKTGERVEGGQTIAIQQSGLGMRSREIVVRMWHNGTPLRPYDYLGETGRPVRDDSSYEAPRGR